MSASKNKIDAQPGILERVGQNVASNFDGILSVKPMAKYFSGARCVLKMNGKIIGFAFAISWRINTSVTPIHTIDNYEDHELAPKRIEVSGVISGFRIPGSGPGVELLQADVLNFLHQRYIEIEVRDSQTDNLLFYTSKALVTNRSENVRTNSLSEMSLEFTAIGYRDERDPSLPKNMTQNELDGKKATNRFDNLIDKAKNVFSSKK
jgi:hypothetical protein